MIHTVDLTAGTVEYEDTGGALPPIVLAHGLAMDGRAWDGVVPALSQRFRCILPTLPLGAHRRAMRSDADLSLRGMGRLLAELIAEAFPRARLVEIDDSYTLIPIDQPERLASELLEFMAEPD